MVALTCRSRRTGCGLHRSWPESCRTPWFRYERPACSLTAARWRNSSNPALQNRLQKFYFTCLFFLNILERVEKTFSNGSSNRVRGGRETWNLCGRLWRPSFLWPIFTGPGGGHAPLGPPGSATDIRKRDSLVFSTLFSRVSKPVIFHDNSQISSLCRVSIATTYFSMATWRLSIASIFILNSLIFSAEQYPCRITWTSSARITYIFIFVPSKIKNDIIEFY